LESGENVVSNDTIFNRKGALPVEKSSKQPYIFAFRWI